MKNIVKAQEKQVCIRTTIFVIGSEKTKKNVFIRKLLKDSLNESYMFISYGMISDSNQVEIPVRVFNINLIEDTDLFVEFPQKEAFEDGEMGFIYIYDYEDDESLKILGEFLEKSNFLTTSPEKLNEYSVNEQIFRRNFTKKIDFLMIGMSENINVNSSPECQELSERFSMKHFFFSENESSSVISQINNEIVSKILKLNELKKKSNLIEAKTTLSKTKIDDEGIETTSKILAIAKLYKDRNQESLLRSERLYLGYPPDILWSESKPIIVAKQEDYWKFFSDLNRQNIPWKIRKQSFFSKNFDECFEFYSPLASEFLEAFSESIVTEYLTKYGKLEISDGNLKLMMGNPDLREFTEAHTFLKEKAQIKFELFKKNNERIFEIHRQNETNFEFHSEFDLPDMQHFCQLVISDFARKNSEKEKKIELSLSDGDLKIMAGFPVQEEFDQIKITLNTLLLQREKIFFTETNSQIEKLEVFKFYNEFDDDGLQEFSRLLVLAFLKASVNNPQKISSDLFLKNGDIKLMSGFPDEKEFTLILNCLENKKTNKIEYFKSNYPSEISSNSRNVFSFYSEFDKEGILEFSRLFVVQFLKSKVSPTMNLITDLTLKDGDIKIMTGHSSDEEIKILKEAIKTEVKKKSSYFPKVISVQKTERKNVYERHFKTNYQLYNEFEESEQRYFVNEIASLKVSNKKQFKRGDIKLLLGQASNEELENTIGLIFSRTKAYVYLFV